MVGIASELMNNRLSLFCNWDFLSMADGAVVISPLEAFATYVKLMPASLSAICSFWTEKSQFSIKLKGPDYRFTDACFISCNGTIKWITVTNLQFS